MGPKEDEVRALWLVQTLNNSWCCCKWGLQLPGGPSVETADRKSA